MASVRQTLGQQQQESQERLAQVGPGRSLPAAAFLPSSAFAGHSSWSPSSPASSKQANKMNMTNASNQLQALYNSLEPPDANTSGLPVPSAAAKLQIPSTVSSALRRRPLLHPPGSSIRPPSSTGLPLGSNNPSNGFAIRRSQSQRPAGCELASSRQAIGRQLHSTGLFPAQIRPPPTTTNRLFLARQVSKDEEPEDPKSSVESLQPLKSTTYINRLISASSSPRNSPNSSLEANKELDSTPPLNAKPSQLVKPIMSNKPASRLPSKLPSPASSRLKKPSSSTSWAAVESNGENAVARRLSLQQLTYNQFNSARTSGKKELSLLGGGSLEESDYEEAEDYEQEDDDDPATTKTHTSDGNNSTANQELNSMIQMLSSKAILGESNNSLLSSMERKRSLAGASSKGSQVPKLKSRVIKSQSTNFATPTRKEDLPKLHRELISDKEKESGCKLGLGKRTLAQVAGGPKKERSFGFQANALAKRDREPASESVKLPRPRSRIIFDPTSSQFHVSCTASATSQQQSSEESSDSDYDDQNEDDDREEGEDEEDEDESEIQKQHNGGDYVRRSDPFDENQDHSQSSLKLIDTHSQIIMLKYLPSIASNSQQDDSLEEASKKKDLAQESETIRKLKNCKGSLESLCIIRNQNMGELLSPSLETPPPPYGSLRENQFALPAVPAAEAAAPEELKRSKSPVGSAFRSLFGLPPSSGIVRHGSLRADPRKCAPSELLQKQSSLREKQATGGSIGGDLFQRAGKKLSASSTSLTSKFKFIGSSSSQGSKTTSEVANNQQDDFQKKDALPPRIPSNTNTQSRAISNALSINSLGPNELDNCDDKACLASEQESRKELLGDDEPDYGTLESEHDTTLLSDTSTIHGEPPSSGPLYVNRCAELERTVESLKNKLLAKEKEMTELQLKQWSDDYLIGQLKSSIAKLQKENVQLRSALLKSGSLA